MDKEGLDFRDLVKKNFKEGSPAWKVLNKSLTALKKPLTLVFPDDLLLAALSSSIINLHTRQIHHPYTR